MKISWNGIKQNSRRLNAAWKISPRWITLSRRNSKVQYAVFCRRQGKTVLESYGEAAEGKLLEDPGFKLQLAFPRVMGTRFGAVLPLEKAQVFEWESDLTAKKQVLQVLPFEMASQIPFPAEEVVFDCVEGEPGGEKKRWLVTVALRQDVEEELRFWSEQGLELDFMEWEGNLQAQLLKDKALQENKTVSLQIQSGSVTHFALADEKGLLAQKIFLDPSGEERQKRLDLKLFQLKQKFQLNEIPKVKIEANLFHLFPSRIQNPLSQINFVRDSLQKKLLSEMAIKKSSALAVWCLAAVLIFQGSLFIEKWGVHKKLARLKQMETEAVAVIAQKTGLTAEEVRQKPLAGHLHPDKTSLVATLIQASEKLSQTTSASYRGHQIELNADKFILEAHADTFADAERVQKDLNEVPLLANVEMIQSHKNDGRVEFRIEADRRY